MTAQAAGHVRYVTSTRKQTFWKADPPCMQCYFTDGVSIPHFAEKCSEHSVSLRAEGNFSFFSADIWGLIQVHWITLQSTLLCILIERFYLLIAATSVSL